MKNKILLLIIPFSFLIFSSGCSSNKEISDNTELVKIIPGEQRVFWYDKPEDYQITPQIKEYLDLILSFVSEKGEEYKSKYVINLEGHSDNTGSPLDNSLRADLRVNAVIEYLTQNGMDKDNIRFKTFSDTVPYSNPNTAEGKKLDRRTDIRFQLK